MGRLLLVVLVIAVATYFIVRALDKSTAAPSARPNLKKFLPPPRPHHVAPDDDEDFLRDLDRKRWQRRGGGEDSRRDGDRKRPDDDA